mgnify:CR=1 FL=1
MDREKIVEAILAIYRKQSNTAQMEMYRNALKHIGDSNLIVLAQNIGVDTDAVLEVLS